MPVVSCAKQGMPSGGLRDVAPPQVKGLRPANGESQFVAQQFVIDFDEYVVLKDAENNILVSPPMSQKPEYSTKGRSIVVKIKDTLLPNTTYLFQFRDAIADFNEGNLLPSLEYVFSTGAAIDSMMLAGRVVDALTQAPRQEPVSVLLLDSTQRQMMIRSQSDTSIHQATAAYITRCDKEGFFTFNHIRRGRYYVVALEDGDKNQMVGISEPVAFADTLWSALAMPRQHATHAADTTKNHSDTAEVSTSQPRGRQTKPILYMFEPESKTQRITGSDFKGVGKVQITTLLPMLSPLVDAGGEQLVWHLNDKGDTMTLWTMREQCDSLQLIVSDSSGIQDTLRLRYRRSRSLSNSSQPSVAGVRFNVKDKLDYFDSLQVLFTVPRKTTTLVDSAIAITRLKDSSIYYASLLIGSNLLKATVDYGFCPGEKYEVLLLPGKSTDIHNKPNDSLRASITITSPNEYGNIALQVGLQELYGGSQVLLQMLNEKGNVLQCHAIGASQQLLFPHLQPGKYRFRAIIDSNGNGQWDGGDFGSLRQPEAVHYYGKTIEVRANWDFEELWEVGR